jgi:hypothetical protein
MAVEIRLLKQSEIALANDFFNTVYGTHRTLKNFEWEFISGPRGRAIYVVAVDTDSPTTKIVGIQCAIPLELVSNTGEIILTAKSEDTLVHPGYRGQKLFERMYDLLFTECKRAGIKYIWGFTPALKAFERIGFTAPFTTSQAVLVLNPLKAYQHLSSLNPANKAIDKFKIAGLSFLCWMKALFKISGNQLIVNKSAHFNTDASLQKYYPSSQKFYFIRQDAAYIKWRLLDNPFNNNYISYQIQLRDTFSTVLINLRSGVSYIEQIFFDPSLSFRERVKVVQNVVRILSAHETPVIRVMCFTNNNEGIEMIRLLEAACFVYLDKGHHFVWKVLDDTAPIEVNQIMLSRLFTQGNA